MNRYGVVVVDTENQVQLIGLDDYHITLDQLYNWVDCDTISLIHTCRDFSDTVLMCIDDNGKLLHKPINNIGTILYGAWPDDFIVGNVAFFSSIGQSEYDEPDAYAMPYNDAIEMYNVCIRLLSR